MIKYIFIGLMLMGCGTGYAPDITWSGNITEQNSRFILSYDKEIYPESIINRIDIWWLDLQECTGVSIDISNMPLIIEYTPLDKLPAGYIGWIYWHDQYARIANSDIFYGYHTRHEMLHYLLFLIKTPDTANSNHESSWFDECILS